VDFYFTLFLAAFFAGAGADAGAFGLLGARFFFSGAGASVAADSLAIPGKSAGSTGASGAA